MDGKLVDDLSPADDRIRESVVRLSDPTAAAAERLEHLARLQAISADKSEDRDRAVAEYGSAARVGDSFLTRLVWPVGS